MQILKDILTNMVANLIFWLGLGLIVGLTVRFGQRKFQKFFGLGINQYLTVCLSNLWSSEISRRPRGYAVALHELRASEAITRLFGSASFRLPDMVRGLVDTVWTGSRGYEFQTAVSPATTEDPRKFEHLASNLIVIGAAARNSVRRLYLDSNTISMKLSNELPEARFHQLPKDQLAVHILVGENAGAQITSTYELAILEKILDHQRNTMVFFCAGMRGDTTWATTEYLVRSWRGLLQEFGNDPFALCLGFRPQDYRYDYSEPIRMHTCRRGA